MSKARDPSSSEERQKMANAATRPAVRSPHYRPNAPTRIDPGLLAASGTETPVRSSDENSDAFRGAATAIQKAPLESEADFSIDIGSIIDEGAIDEGAIDDDNAAGAAPVEIDFAPIPDVDDVENVDDVDDVELEDEHDAPSPAHTPYRFDDDDEDTHHGVTPMRDHRSDDVTNGGRSHGSGIHSAVHDDDDEDEDNNSDDGDDDRANPFRDSATHVDLPSIASEEAVDDDVPFSSPPVEEYAVSDERTAPLSSHRPVARTTVTPFPPFQDDPEPEPERDAVQPRPETRADHDAFDGPGTEIESESPPEVAKWRVVPTGWENAPAPAPPSYDDPMKRVQTVLWDQAPGGEAPAGKNPAFSSVASTTMFQAGTGAQKLALSYVYDALVLLDEFAPLFSELEPESRRAVHAKAFACAQKLRRALSLLEEQVAPDDDEQS